MTAWAERNVLSVNAFILGCVSIFFRAVLMQEDPIFGDHLYDTICFIAVLIILALNKRDERASGRLMFELQNKLSFMLLDGTLSEDELVSIRNWILNNIMELLFEQGGIGDGE